MCIRDRQYRYVVESRHNTIFDKAYNVYLINKGSSMIIIDDEIYAIGDNIYLTINQKNNIIHVYYLNPQDIESINKFNELQQQYYGNKMILQPVSYTHLDVYKRQI